MSLILDALKRAQDNRQAAEGTASPSDLLQPLPPHAPTKSVRGFLWLIIVLLLAILIMLWFLLRKTNEVDTAVISTKSISSTTVSKIAEPIITEVRISSSISSQSPVPSSVINDLYQQANSSAPGVKDVKIAQLYVETEQVYPSPTEEFTQSESVVNPLPDINAQLPEPMQVTAEIRSIKDLIDVITFEDLSLKQKQLFPSVNYSQHNYLGNSASSVVINGELMRVRSRITDGIEIIEILEDGIVLSVNGRRVSFKALNSWINM